jgi:Fe-S-cluster containining protein
VETPPDNLRDAVHAAANRPEVRAQVEQIYTDLAQEIENRKPRCILSGRCCHFEAFGHRLYVTTAELATFLHGFEHHNQSPQLADSIKTWTGQGCPFQLNKLCGVHPLRPFGCRIYFCDETSTDWQNQTYEIFHARLKQLHEELSIPYFYTEWRTALQSLSLLNPKP